MYDFAYLEVGHRCYCKCRPCSAVGPDGELPYDQTHTMIRRMEDMGVKNIRLTGLEPLSNHNIATIMGSSRLETQFTMLTTLLSPHLAPAVICDDLRVSLMGTYDNYTKYHCGGDWDLFNVNFNKLCEVRDDIKVYTTVIPEFFNEGLIEQTVQYINDHKDNISEWSIFPSSHLRGVDPNMTLSLYEKARLDILRSVEVPFVFDYDNVTHNVNRCNVSRKTFYVRFNGDIYPCCMTGGEVGDLLPELKLGNLLDPEFDTFHGIKSRVLTDLNNRHCNACTPKYFQLIK